MEAYCRTDVELMRDLLAFGAREGHVCVRTQSGVAVRVPVAWDVRQLARSSPGRARSLT